MYIIYIYISFDICYILIEKQVELLKTNINDNISQGFQKKKINSAKHVGQGMIFFCSCSGIVW